MQPVKDSIYFANELALKKLVSSGKVSLVYIHGTARSGSTIAEIIFSQFAQVTIHQPFRGILQNRGGRLRNQKLEFDADIYDAGCGLIVEQINKTLKDQQKFIVIVKELAGFFQPPIWKRWIQIPDRFLFTIREPHLQYMSWLSAMTDKIFQGKGKLQENRTFVLEKAAITENSILPAEWEGTTLSCNQAAWQALIRDFNQVKKSIAGSNKKVAILDSILLRSNPVTAINKVIEKLDWQFQHAKPIGQNLILESHRKIFDIRDKSRPMVRKANNSKKINPLVSGEAISLGIFPLKSQQHIEQIIPIYLDLLYAPEQVYLPSLAELNTTKTTALTKTHPFIAYAIALFHLHQQTELIEQITALIESLKNSELTYSSRTTANSNKLWKIIDCYWKRN